MGILMGFPNGTWPASTPAHENHRRRFAFSADSAMLMHLRVPGQEHGLQLNIWSFLRSSTIWHPGRCSSLSQRGHASGPSSASSEVWHRGQLTRPLWSLALTSVEQEFELWFIRSLLALTDVSLYHVFQIFHLYFPMLNWSLPCCRCLVKAIPSVLVSPKTLLEQPLFVPPQQHCQTTHDNPVWDTPCNLARPFFHSRKQEWQ